MYSGDDAQRCAKLSEGDANAPLLVQLVFVTMNPVCNCHVNPASQRDFASSIIS